MFKLYSEITAGGSKVAYNEFDNESFSFKLEETNDSIKGIFTAKLENVEVMGREKSIICSHPACEKPVIRAIVEDFKIPDSKDGETSVTFSFKKGKVFLFNRETEVRLYEEETEVKKTTRKAPTKKPTTTKTTTRKPRTTGKTERGA